MLRHDIGAGIEFEGEVVVHEPGVRLGEFQLAGIVIYKGVLLHPLFDDTRVAQFGGMLDEHVDGEDQVPGRERLAIAPLGALANVDGQLGEIVVVLVALCQPENLLVGKGGEEDQGLEHGGHAVLVRKTAVHVAQPCIRPATSRSPEHIHERFLAGYLLDTDLFDGLNDPGYLFLDLDDLCLDNCLLDDLLHHLRLAGR